MLKYILIFEAALSLCCWLESLVTLYRLRELASRAQNPAGVVLDVLEALKSNTLIVIFLICSIIPILNLVLLLELTILNLNEEDKPFAKIIQGLIDIIVEDENNDNNDDEVTHE